MTKKQSQKLAMYMAVLRILRNQNTLLESAPALEALRAELERLVAEIQHTASRRSYLRKGLALAKSIEREELVRLADTVTAAIRAWATHTGDAPLARRFSTSWSTYRQMRQMTLPAQVEALLAEARAFGVALEPFGVSAALLDTLEASRNRYLELVAQPRTAIVNHRTATAALVELFRQADALLKERIDLLLVAARGSDLYRDYQGARLLVGARRNAANSGPDAVSADGGQKPADSGTVSGLTARGFGLQAAW